jgi:hypothetical protein
MKMAAVPGCDFESDFKEAGAAEGGLKDDWFARHAGDVYAKSFSTCTSRIAGR